MWISKLTPCSGFLKPGRAFVLRTARVCSRAEFGDITMSCLSVRVTCRRGNAAALQSSDQCVQPPPSQKRRGRQFPHVSPVNTPPPLRPADAVPLPSLRCGGGPCSMLHSSAGCNGVTRDRQRSPRMTRRAPCTVEQQALFPTLVLVSFAGRGACRACRFDPHLRGYPRFTIPSSTRRR